MQFYARKVLERHGVWQEISSGKECVSCQTTERNWFTAVHHRETIDRIRAGVSDVGIVWKTEVLEALRAGEAIDGVELPLDDSLRQEVSYVIGEIIGSRRAAAAKSYLTFLTTADGQNAYAKFGFVAATTDELLPKAIP